MSQPSWNEQGETQMFPATGRHAVRVAAPAMDPTSEPVIISHAVTVILGALVTAGWVAIPNSTIDIVGTVVALALSTVGAVVARARVAPVQGGIWGAISGYVADLVTAELGKLASQQVPAATPGPVAAPRPAVRFSPPGA